MAEEAARPFDHRAVQGDATGLADRVFDGVKPLITLAFEGAYRAFAEIRKALIALVDLLRAVFRRPVGGGQPLRTANRFANSAGTGGPSVDDGGAWLRFRALSIEGAAVGKSALRGAAECARVVLILCCRYGLAACRVVSRRAREFHRDGKVELTMSEAAVALLVLASLGFSLAWLISDTDPRAERPAGAPPTDGGALPAMDAVHKIDPIRAMVPDIPTKELAELLTERPSLEGRLYWAERPMPLPMLASLPEQEIRLATTARPTPVPRAEPVEITVADTPTAAEVPPTYEAQPADVVALPPPMVASSEAPQTTVGKPSPPPATVSTGKPEVSSAIPPEPRALGRDKVSDIQPKLALAPPPPRPEPLASAGMGSIATYQVQLIAVRARDQALKMWENLLAKHRDVLGDLEPDISSKRTRKRRLVYRLRAGPIDSKSAARALCATLSKRKIDCLVVRASG